MKKEKIKYMDISGSMDGFKIYNDCALHIGFRVHAHIYMLSQRRPSILIEEDLRGDGINSILGLPSINASSNVIRLIKNKYLRKLLCELNYYPNHHLLDFVDSVLNYYECTEYKPFEWAFERMHYYYSKMITHLQSIQKIM